MDSSAQILQQVQLSVIKWLITVITVCFLIIAGSLTVAISDRTRTSSYRARSASFTSRAGDLLDEGKSKDVISMTEEREKTYPLDPYVYWYRGRAYYQLGQYDAALKAMNRAEELCPGWREEYTGLFIKIIGEKLAAHKT
jgi:tetratricopeptide (TPR) repeat protein